MSAGESAKGFKQADGFYFIPIPSGKLPYQTRDKMTVTGAAEFKTEEMEGNEGLAIKFQPGQPIRIQFQVTLKPYAYRAELATNRSDAGIPQEARRYLGKNQWIDPRSLKLREIVTPLRRDTCAAMPVRIIKSGYTTI